MRKQPKKNPATNRPITVEDVKAALPKNFIQLLIERTGKKTTFLSQMVNNLETHRPEWAEVNNLIKEHKAATKARMDEVKRQNTEELNQILA